MKIAPAPLVIALGLLSLVEWTPVAVAERLIDPVLIPGTALVRWLGPRDEAALGRAEHVETLRAQALAGWEAWCVEVLQRTPPGDPSVRLALAPVVAVDGPRRELLVRAPGGPLRADTPVTWCGVLLGFLRPWRAEGGRVEVDGLARVALLGHPLARPVAGAWRAGPRAADVHFLLESGPDGPRIAHASRPFDPRPGQLTWSRDVLALGDDLPAGLLLGRVAAPPSERPGGGEEARPGSRIEIEPLLDPSRLSHVVVEVLGGVEPLAPIVEAGLLSGCSERAVRIDRGLVDGVRKGDFVLQGALRIGVVESAGPFSAVVVRGAAPGQLLVIEEEDRRVVPVTQDDEGWPPDWVPRPGAAVVSGHRTRGGLHVGVLRGAHAGRLLLEAPPVDEREPLLVIAP